MFISNTYITDNNSSPARIFSYKKREAVALSPQLMLMLSCCVLVWCSTLQLFTNHGHSSVAVSGLPALL